MKKHKQILNENIYFVYKHYKSWNKEIFYIGMGEACKDKSFARSCEKNGRSRFWKYITKKYKWKHQVLAKNMSFDMAESLEIGLIAHYGRRDLGKGTLCNLTDGGGGTKNPSPEHSQKISTGNIEHWKNMTPEEYEYRCSLTSGENNPMHRIHGRPCPAKGKPSPRKGKKLIFKQTKCMHCGKEGTVNQVKRSVHFDNCLEHSDLKIRAVNRLRRKTQADRIKCGRLRCHHCSKLVTWIKLETEHLNNCKRHPFLQK